MNKLYLVLPILCIVVSLCLKTRYASEINKISSKIYPFKRLLGIGFFLYQISGTKIQSTIRKRYSKNKIETPNIIIHVANEITTILILLSLMVGLSGAFDFLDAVFMIFIIFTLVIVYIAMEQNLEKTLAITKKEFLYDFPNFLTKLAILMEAGISLRRAIEKIIPISPSTVLQKEFNHLLNDVRSGRSEIQAFEELSRRMKIYEVTKFVSIVIQNIQKGNNVMAAVIRILARESWESKRRAAVKMGEEASAKMVFPLIVILLAIMLILAMPAVVAIYKIS